MMICAVPALYLAENAVGAGLHSVTYPGSLEPVGALVAVTMV
jgi:hypothetical protein